MSEDSGLTPDSAAEEARRRSRIGVLVFVVVLVATAFAWTGFSLRDLLARLHF